MHIAMYHPNGTVAVCDSLGERKKKLVASGYFESKLDADTYAAEQKKAAAAKKAAVKAKEEVEKAKNSQPEDKEEKSAKPKVKES